MIKKKKGQGTLEYLVLVTAVVTVMLAFLASSNSPFRSSYNDTLQTATDGMTNMADRLQSSRPLSTS